LTLDNQAEIIISSVWNSHNNDPLDDQEINYIISSAYGNNQYSYGCAENSPLRKYLNCVGSEKCLFLAISNILKRE